MLNNRRCAGLDANHHDAFGLLSERDPFSFLPKHTRTHSVTCDYVYVCVYDR